jgi:ubiquinone/menaquinone biosynthesis C-methylase UbiE
VSGRAGSAYHLGELAIARDPRSPSHVLPVFGDADRTILDIGCGAGQSLIAAELDDGRTAVGVDVDREALALGRTLTEAVQFVAAPAERLPFGERRFDLVISRVALPYTDIPRAVAEIARVLRPGGRCWLLLHPPAFALRELAAAVAHGRVRSIVYQVYVLANGLALELLGRQFAYPLRRARFESVQTTRGMRRSLGRAGFERIEVERGRFFVVTAVRRG